MAKTMNRRKFIRTSSALGGLTYISLNFPGCDTEYTDYLITPKEFDVFFKYKKARKIYRFDTSNLEYLLTDNSDKSKWLIQSIASVFQGLVNRIEPRIYLHSKNSVDWLLNYIDDGHQIDITDISDFKILLNEFAPLLEGYIVIDPNMLHTLNIAQTWGSIENWMVVTPEMEQIVKEAGLERKMDLRNRWNNRISAYEWAFDNLFPSCSKHVVGDCCIEYPYHPSKASFHIRDFLVANKAFTFDLSASLSYKKEYRLLDKIYDSLEFPAGVWGWHDSRDHERWAVDRAARKGVYTVCAVGGPNLTVHGGVKPKEASFPKQKPSPRENLVAEKNKVYIAHMMSDGDALWVLNSLQLFNWATEKRGDFPLAWGFLPLLADIAPSMYLHYINTMKDNDYMVAGPSGAAYTYPHMHPDPRKFLRYSKFYMEKCGLEMVYMTNWDDYTNWQEVDTEKFNNILFEEMDNCIGYLRGLGESAFEPNYNFGDKPFIFMGEGFHAGDKSDVDTLKNFIEANTNRPLFIFILSNIAVGVERIKTVVEDLKDYNIETVRLDDFIKLIKSAYKQGLITEDLYPNKEGNKQILINEAPVYWEGTKENIEILGAVINASSEAEALDIVNSEDAQMALGEKITDEDKSDVLAFYLCEAMFSIVRYTSNLEGIYVNLRKEGVKEFQNRHRDWEGIGCLSKYIKIWENWDDITLRWNEVVELGKDLLKVFHQADKLFV